MGFYDKHQIVASNPDAVVVEGYGTIVRQFALLWAKWWKKHFFIMFVSSYQDRPRNWMKEFVKKWSFIKLCDGAFPTGKRAKEYIKQLNTCHLFLLLNLEFSYLYFYI